MIIFMEVYGAKFMNDWEAFDGNIIFLLFLL
jgi:hypothetical protein